MFGCIPDTFFAFIDHWINALLLVTFSFQELIGNYIYMEEYFMRETVMKVSFHGNKYLNTSREEDKRESLLPAMPLFLTRSWMDDYSS